MKTLFYLAIGIGILAVLGFLEGRPTAAQETTKEPLITVTAANQPLGEVLDQITGETGYQFSLDPKWENHRISATLRDVPLERGLKRLLRSLNHTIIWESDNIVTIVVYGNSESGQDQGAVSFAPPPREIPAEPERELEQESGEAPTDRSESSELEPPQDENAPRVEAIEESDTSDAGRQDDDNPVDLDTLPE